MEFSAKYYLGSTGLKKAVLRAFMRVTPKKRPSGFLAPIII